MYLVKVAEYPNNEVRTTLSRVRSPKRLLEASTRGKSDGDLPQDSTNPYRNPLSLLDIRSKVESEGLPVENSQDAHCKPGWGELPRPTKFSTYARRCLSRCGGALDAVVSDPGEVVFLTGTIPNGKDDGRIMASAYSGMIVHSLKAWVNFYQPAKYDFYVWEYQSRGALHLHYCVWVPDAEARQRILDGFWGEWLRILERVSDLSGIDMLYSDNGSCSRSHPVSLQAYAQPVRVSVVGYLAKYFDKEDCKASGKPGVVLYAPSRWYGCSQALLRECRSRTTFHEMLTHSRRKAMLAHETITALCGSVATVCHQYQVKVTGFPVTVAYQVPRLVIQQVCQVLRGRIYSQDMKSYSNFSVSITSRCLAILRTFSLSPSTFFRFYTPSSVIAVEALLAGRCPTIAETMEVLDGLHYVLWYLYPNYGRTHPDYGRAQKALENMRNEVLLRQRQSSTMWEAPLTKLD